MDKVDFKKLLFKTAFCVMACDGSIDELEIQEMKKIDTNTSYFNDVDLSQELNELIDNLKNKNIKLVKNLFDTLRKTKLSITQELLIIEIILRIINADNIIDDNEVRFLNIIRSKLEISDQIIFERFGKIPYLKNLSIEDLNVSQKNFINEVNISDIDNLEEIKLT